MSCNIELRCFANSELRAAAGHKLTGYAAIFGQLSQPLGHFREKIKAGAFSRTLAEGADVRALVDHNPSKVIGRTKSGTLSLREDIHGLLSTIDLPDTTVGRDLYESVRRGDVSQMSFGFRMVKDSWPSRTERILEDVDLFDVSVVSFPAYPQTSVSVRGIEIGWYGLDESIPQVAQSEDDREKLRLMLKLAQRL